MSLFNNARDSWIGNNQKRVYDSTKGSRTVKRNAVNEWRRKNGIPGSYTRYSKSYHDSHYSGKPTGLLDLIFGK